MTKYLSDIPLYVDYARAISSNNLTAARDSLELLRKEENDITQECLAFVETEIARIFLEQKQVDKAASFYILASFSFQSWQIKVGFIEFLNNHFSSLIDVDILVCNLLDQLKSNPFPETEEDFGSIYYVEKLEALRR